MSFRKSAAHRSTRRRRAQARADPGGSEAPVDMHGGSNMPPWVGFAEGGIGSSRERVVRPYRWRSSPRSTASLRLATWRRAQLRFSTRLLQSGGWNSRRCSAVGVTRRKGRVA
ncbi:putative pollen-specific leucine-rich repeat extensin-like protein 3 [Iris pallida]|uniref:Pollen-specific leucine-rich repeat extensin-like protein 3 n=1 Tax=Iris pallida TaxID=29817 RepID=A0AAX6FGQ3_IRIPA|nr:putative pollen-specific leucine-rich repeat extensin-like protein 3 [Iris pallida]